MAMASGRPQGHTGGLRTMGLVVGLILATLAWDYTTNPLGHTNPLAVIATSLTTMAAKGAPDQLSLGVLWLVLGTTLVSTLAAVAEETVEHEVERDAAWWARSLGVVGGIAVGSGGLYALIHAARLAPGAETESLIYEYLVMLLLFWAAMAWTLSRASIRLAQGAGRPWVYAYPLIIVVALLFSNAANIRVVRADVLYKHGLKFDEQGNWDAATHYYERAIDLAPREDYYRLFHGRALLEQAKAESDPARRDALFEEALTSLETARRLNPLNTDHTANLARLYRTWAESAADAAQREERLREATRYYAAATQLSPNNAQLYNEWGLAQFLLGDYEAALQTYDQSLALDRAYPQTYLLRADVYLARKEWPLVVEECRQAVALDSDLVQAWSAMGYAYSQMGDWEEAIAANLRVYALAPDDYNTLKNLAILYDRAQQPNEAMTYAELALAAAPEAERATIEAFLQELRGGGEEASS